MKYDQMMSKIASRRKEDGQHPNGCSVLRVVSRKPSTSVPPHISA
jgi:hypothetical protein